MYLKRNISQTMETVFTVDEDLKNIDKERSRIKKTLTTQWHLVLSIHVGDQNGMKE